MKEIPLSHAMVAMVDDEDFDRLANHTWAARKSVSSGYYAIRLEQVNGKQVQIYMHQEILPVVPPFVVDHQDRNGLNNQRGNLRPATRSQNRINSRMRSDNKTGFRGVTACPGKSMKWRSIITVAGRTQHLGYFQSAEEAALAYDRAAIQLHGEFAQLNFRTERTAA
jgi:hypothetical protein